jgi:hypothetical protein
MLPSLFDILMFIGFAIINNISFVLFRNREGEN